MKKKLLYLYSIIISLFLLLLFALIHAIYHIDESNDTLFNSIIPLINIRGEIIYFDEVLTMSTNVAAYSGELRWKKRYDHFEPILLKQIDEASHLMKNVFKEIEVFKTNDANNELVKI